MAKLLKSLGLVPLLCCLAGPSFAAGSAAASASEAFLQTALLSSRAEVELGELAQKNAGSTGVNALGTRLARDHKRIGKILEMLSQERGLVIPAAQVSDQRSVIDELSSKKGEEFDAAYAERMVISHSALIELFDEATTSDDPDVAAFAQQALPLLKEGKRLAEVYRDVTSRGRTQDQTQAIAAAR